jgi:hypothetical protein
MIANVHTGRQVILMIVVALLAACQKELPMAPSDLASGIVVYEHANYLGESAHITADVDDLMDFKGPCRHTTNCGQFGCETTDSWDDCISSVRVAAGWQAVLWEDDDFSGDRLTVTGDIPNLDATRGCSSRGFNDCVTSIRLIRP